jgi:acetyltransferase-like isoleucine patch superfamily enzyme
MAFLSQSDVEKLGFRSVGWPVFLSDKASVHGAERISIGSYVRIDDFSVLSAGHGGIEIGSFIHVATGASLIGAELIHLGDFCNLSGRVSIYSSNDDYSGWTMTNPMVPEHLKNVDSRPVRIGRHVIIGAGTVVLPGVTISNGAAIGALSLVNKDVPDLEIHGGVPARYLGARSSSIFELEKKIDSTAG